MVIYLDNSFLNRPFDNPNIRQNRLESEVLFFIVDLVQEEGVTLVNSSVITYENSLNPFYERKIFIEELLDKTKLYQNLNTQIEKRAEQLVKDAKITSIDALHLATAEHAHVDFFITCDYNLIKRYKGTLRVILPLDFLKYHESN